MAYTPATLTALLNDLNLTSSAPNHTEILKHANNVLKTNKTNAEAIRTRLVALLHLDRYEEVVRSVHGTKAEQEASFELAYALYKTGKLEEAARIAREAGGKEGAERGRRGLVHLEAQAAYRSGNFEVASKIYNDLIDSGKIVAPNEDFDLKVNRSATDAQLLWSGAAVERRKVTGDELSAFETAYNTACIHVSREEFPQALILLKKAEDLCNALDLSAEEKTEELAPVLAQRIYILAKLGKVDEAVKLSESLDIKGISDASVQYIAANNDIALKSQSTQNPHLTYRLFDLNVAKPIAAATVKPFKFQEKILSRNLISLDLQVGKYQAVETAAKKLGDESQAVFSMAAKVQGKPAKEALKDLEKVLAKEENKSDVGLVLYYAQLQLEAGNITGATETVTQLLTAVGDKYKHSPALVGLLVALHKRQGRTKPTKELADASEYWKNASQPNEDLLFAQALNLLTSNQKTDLSAAGELFSSIRTTLTPSLLSAGIVASNATIDLSKAQSHTATLPAVSDLIKGINIDSLESAGLYVPTKKRPLEDTESTKKTKQPLAKKKRVRKSRLPKDFDPSKKLDLERWLPLRDRSYYRPKGGKKDKKRMMAQGASQGGKGAEEEQPEKQAAAASPVVVAGKTPAAGGAAKKKKKKGGKW